MYRFARMMTLGIDVHRGTQIAGDWNDFATATTFEADGGRRILLETTVTIEQLYNAEFVSRDRSNSRAKICNAFDCILQQY